MQAEVESPKRTGPWLIGLIIGVFLAMIAWTVFGSKTPDDSVPTITSGTEYLEDLKRAEDLSRAHLEDFDNGQAMTEQQQRDLRKAAGIFDALAAFQPTNIAPFVGAGKCYQALGNDEAAIRRFQQGLATVPPKPLPAIHDTAVETHYLLSVSLFNLHEYDKALTEVNAAMTLLKELFPYGSPIYLSQRAAIYIEQRKYKEAAQDLVTALRIDPNHKRSKSLLKLIALSTSHENETQAIQNLNKKNYAAAIKSASAGLEVDPANLRLLAVRASAYIETHQKEKAQADVTTMVALDPDSEDAKVLKKRLQ